MPRVVHFEISADNAKRAVKFYADVFGWKIHEWEGPLEYYLLSTGEKDEPGIDGAITKRQYPELTTVNTISVPSIDDFMEKITGHGGRIVTEKTVIPGIGQFCYCQDTEGNTFGIIEEDTAAK
jgi:predicted enzyme related to lactoylglutathione lyase